jgi:hypothetical protein
LKPPWDVTTKQDMEDLKSVATILKKKFFPKGEALTPKIEEKIAVVASALGESTSLLLQLIRGVDCGEVKLTAK